MDTQARKDPWHLTWHLTFGVFTENQGSKRVAFNLAFNLPASYRKSGLRAGPQTVPIVMGGAIQKEISGGGRAGCVFAVCGAPPITIREQQI